MSAVCTSRNMGMRHTSGLLSRRYPTLTQQSIQPLAPPTCAAPSPALHPALDRCSSLATTCSRSCAVLGVPPKKSSASLPSSTTSIWPVASSSISLSANMAPASCMLGDSSWGGIGISCRGNRMWFAELGWYRSTLACTRKMPGRWCVQAMSTWRMVLTAMLLMVSLPTSLDMKSSGCLGACACTSPRPSRSVYLLCFSSRVLGSRGVILLLLLHISCSWPCTTNGPTILSLTQLPGPTCSLLGMTSGGTMTGTEEP
mmetsp:Transcript_37696/g.83958  ORF Transcript_37696/g.83958 Transcript_37696/m.83958 type:complete len:257 (-) Transcript_37696:893-1663(-)